MNDTPSPIPPPRIHASVCLDAPCEVGAGTRIWHFTHVREGSRIGDYCIVGQNVYIGAGVQIGNHCKIQNNVSVYEGVTLEDEVFVGPSAVFTNVINPRAAIERKHEIRPTRVLRGATIGANATVVCGVTIGRWAFVGAGSVVTRSIPEFALVVGVPARQVGWVCRCGVRLIVSEDQATCRACGEKYRYNPKNRTLHLPEEISEDSR
jgi:UDP-2-acetamido-3-amino-2,3-dideoxy-glucuronate N-acetyltransferase